MLPLVAFGQRGVPHDRLGGAHLGAVQIGRGWHDLYLSRKSEMRQYWKGTVKNDLPTLFFFYWFGVCVPTSQSLLSTGSELFISSQNQAKISDDTRGAFILGIPINIFNQNRLSMQYQYDRIAQGEML